MGFLYFTQYQINRPSSSSLLCGTHAPGASDVAGGEDNSQLPSHTSPVYYHGSSAVKLFLEWQCSVFIWAGKPPIPTMSRILTTMCAILLFCGILAAGQVSAAPILLKSDIFERVPFEIRIDSDTSVALGLACSPKAVLASIFRRLLISTA